MALTSEPVSIRKCVRVCESLTKKRRLEFGPVALVATSVRPKRSPAAGLLALLGGFTKFFVVPAERLLQRVSGGGASGAASSQFTAVSSRAVLGERVDEVSEASHFSASEVVREMADTDGAATLITLSAMSASLARSVFSSAKARTMCMFGGSRWRNSFLRKLLLSAAGPR